MAKYIKLPTDFWRREPINQLSHEAVLAYIMLLCDAYEADHKGIYKIADGILLTDEDLNELFEMDGMAKCVLELEDLGLVKRNLTNIEVYKYWSLKRDRNSPEYRKWRHDVFERDSYKCQTCGTNKDLQAHHKLSWKKSPQERYNVDNGITLCRRCHLKIHGGCWRNNGR